MQTQNLVERLFGSALGALDLFAIHLGDQLGWYAALQQSGSCTPAELAERSGADARYAREWLEQQTVGGLLEVDDSSAAAEDRRYRLPDEHVPVLLDRDRLEFLAPLARMIVAAGMQMPTLEAAYRDGSGVGWGSFGSLMRTAQADMNRPWYLRALGQEWLPAVPEMHERLQAGARVADVGCGEGWSSIGMALAYPEVRVDGYDVDRPSVEAATVHAAGYGVADRVEFREVDAGRLAQTEPYDLVTAFECIHDLPDPVSVLASMRGMVRDDGHVLVMDEAVPDEFTGAGDDVERLMYGLSLMVCLPDGLSHQPSVGTGTVMRPRTLEGYAREAGFTGLEVLPVENDLWRFYRLLL